MADQKNKNRIRKKTAFLQSSGRGKAVFAWMRGQGRNGATKKDTPECVFFGILFFLSDYSAVYGSIAM